MAEISQRQLNVFHPDDITPPIIVKPDQSQKFLLWSADEILQRAKKRFEIKKIGNDIHMEFKKVHADGTYMAIVKDYEVLASLAVKICWFVLNDNRPREIQIQSHKVKEGSIVSVLLIRNFFPDAYRNTTIESFIGLLRSSQARDVPIANRYVKMLELSSTWVKTL